MTTGILPTPLTSNAPPPLAPPLGGDIAMGLLALPVPKWFRGLIRPSRVHLLETEDGQPRTVSFDGCAAGVAPCRTLLGGDGVDASLTASADVCRECLAAAVALFGDQALGGA